MDRDTQQQQTNTPQRSRTGGGSSGNRNRTSVPVPPRQSSVINNNWSSTQLPGPPRASYSGPPTGYPQRFNDSMTGERQTRISMSDIGDVRYISQSELNNPPHPARHSTQVARTSSPQDMNWSSQRTSRHSSQGQRPDSATSTRQSLTVEETSQNPFSDPKPVPSRHRSHTLTDKEPHDPFVTPSHSRSGSQNSLATSSHHSSQQSSRTPSSDLPRKSASPEVHYRPSPEEIYQYGPTSPPLVTQEQQLDRGYPREKVIFSVPEVPQNGEKLSRSDEKKPPESGTTFSAGHDSSFSTGLIRPYDGSHFKTCKICQEGEEVKHEKIIIDGPRNIKKGRLMSPCKCKGLTKYVHVGCLWRWHGVGQRQGTSYICDDCKYEYRSYRLQVARVLGSRISLHGLTILVLLVDFYLASLLAKVVIRNLIQHGTPSYLPEFMSLNIWEWLGGAVILSVIGLIFLLYCTYRHGVRGIKSLYRRSCPCFASPGRAEGSSTFECGTFGTVLVILFLMVFFVFGLLVGFSGAYVFIQREVNFFLRWVKGLVLDVSKN